MISNVIPNFYTNTTKIAVHKIMFAISRSKLMFVAGVNACIRSEKIFYHDWNTFEVIFKHENSNSMSDQ